MGHLLMQSNLFQGIKRTGNCLKMCCNKIQKHETKHDAELVLSDFLKIEDNIRNRITNTQLPERHDSYCDIKTKMKQNLKASKLKILM